VIEESDREWREFEGQFNEATPLKNSADSLRTAPQKIALAGIDHFMDSTGIYGCVTMDQTLIAVAAIV
jgi:hypothetical protein